MNYEIVLPPSVHLLEPPLWNHFNILICKYCYRQHYTSVNPFRHEFFKIEIFQNLWYFLDQNTSENKICENWQKKHYRKAVTAYIVYETLMDKDYIHIYIWCIWMYICICMCIFIQTLYLLYTYICIFMIYIHFCVHEYVYMCIYF